MADEKSITSTGSGGKRKRGMPLAFYAVKVGRTPGVYQTWEEANSQVQGFPNAEYKKFGTFTEAEAMVKGTSASNSKSGKTKYYGVAVGHIPGVYTDYATVQAQVKGYQGSKQKAFATHAEALAFVNEAKRSNSTPISLRGDLSETSSLAADKGIKENISKKQKKDTNTPLPALANGELKTIKLDFESGTIRHKTEEELGATKAQPTGDFQGPIVVYTDGSSLGNGQAGAVGGVGVYFGPRDPRNVSEPLRGAKQTNQRAELTAVARALDHIPIDRDTLIITDSYYSIRCLTEWFPKWERNNWKNSAGKDVENKDLIEPIIARIRERELCRAKTNFKWIKGHANDPGNVAADSLAVQGSRSSTEELRNAPEFSVTLNMLSKSPYFSTTSSETLPKQEEDVEDSEIDALLYDALSEEPENEKDKILLENGGGR